MPIETLKPTHKLNEDDGRDAKAFTNLASETVEATYCSQPPPPRPPRPGQCAPQPCGPGPGRCSQPPCREGGLNMESLVTKPKQGGIILEVGPTGKK